MKLQFDPNQTFQLDAVAAVSDLFEGQPSSVPEFSVIKVFDGEGLFEGQDRSELGVGNRIAIDEARLRGNARAVQSRNEIDVADESVSLDA